ncbi:NAD(P)H-dependent oxidoreductase [Liquorilactobacillus uvarum]|uniref:Flavodoxin-like fold domain-containing protein n=1 Tax=Liquorilactobacillus uvarum DSM 19971 TaxID=1423812 RepID=A0A0R1Q394_9LACO|nr:NAD(P)H-dependent oxidoreductase [Liquorilactobacillus uvarum]KRL37300.1 hypothetical protein FD20_GL000481 [Liquorilactobacillus uvarum DSM 19971]
MKTIVIVAHPQLEDSGTQRFLKEATTSLKNVERHELNINKKGHFDTAAEKELLKRKGRIIFQFPLYWYSAPAILKQWMDEVFDITDAAWLQEKELGLVVSLGQPLREYRLGGREGLSLSNLLSPFQAFAQRLKMQMMPLFIIEQFIYQTEEEHQELLIKYQQFLELPIDFSFDQCQSWFEDKLKEIMEKSSIEDRKNLKMLLDSFGERHEQLNELKREVSLIRREDGYYGE